jgi:outer membrane receptor protein involved in Fe transport
MVGLAALLATLALVAAEPEGAVRGRVINQLTGLPVAGAEITIAGERGSVRTDDAGRFQWPLSPRPPVDIIVMLRDGRVARPIRLTAFESAKELTLSVDVTMSQVVAVLGAAPSVDVSPAASTTLLTSRDVDLRQPQSLSQAIDVVPGVSTIGEGQSAVPAIRGMARGRTLILVDGGRVSAERRAGPNASFLDPNIAQTIEVARGPASVAYGSDAFGGVIATRTRGPDFNRPLHVRFAGTVASGVSEQRGDVEISSGYGTGGILVGVRARDVEDYDAPGGIVTNSAWRDQGVRVRWDQATGEGLWTIGWQSDFGRDLGRPRSDSDVMLASSPYEDSHRLTASYERRSLGALRNLRFDALVGAQRQRNEQDRLPAPTRARSVERADISSRELQLRVTGERSLGPARLHAGADVQGRYGLEALDSTIGYNLAGAVTSETASVSIDNAHRTATGLFAEIDVQVASPLRLSGGIRVDAVRNTNTGGFFGNRAVTHAAPAGVFAATLTPAGRLAVTAQVARGFRDPILLDRFYRGPVGRGFIEGNPDLEPETSLQFDLAGRYRIGALRLAAAAYHYRITSLVERYAATATSFLFRNRGVADLRGFEFEAQAMLPSGFIMAVTAETSRGRDAADGTPLDDVAPASVSIALRHGLGDRLASYARFSMVGPHDLAGPSEVSTESYQLLDGGVVWRLSRHLELRGALRNLLDEEYQSSAGPRWVWAPGRQMSLTAAASF